MKIDIKKSAIGIVALFSVLAIFGISWGSISGKFGEIWNAGERIEALERSDRMKDSIIAIQDKRIHHLEIQGRMSYETDRILTDNLSPVIYEVENMEGDKYDVNIRGTNEGAEIAFISDIWMQYPLYYDIDGRMYVTLHNEATHERKGTYITEK